jgi:hypothetical protein
MWPDQLSQFTGLSVELDHSSNCIENDHDDSDTNKYGHLSSSSRARVDTRNLAVLVPIRRHDRTIQARLCGLPGTAPLSGADRGGKH